MSTLTEPRYRDENFKFREVFYIKFSEKFLNQKKRHISKTTQI